MSYYGWTTVAADESRHEGMGGIAHLSRFINMTRKSTTDGDADAFDTVLRAIAAGHPRPEEPDVRRAAGRLFGRPDALELLREVMVEEQQLRRIHVEIGGGSGQGSGLRVDERLRVMPIPSLVNGVGSLSAGSSWRRFGLAAAAVLAIGIGLNWSAASELLLAFRAGGAAVSRTVATRAAELDTVDLPDGSRVILAPNSHLEYAMTPRTGPREIRLDGEAFFDVRHDDERPFRVQTRHVVVEDLGTTFVVREYAGDGRARVAVRTGAAALRAREGPRTLPTSLRPGEGAYVDSSGTIARFSSDPESYGAWTTGRLQFDGAPLPEALSQLARWYGVEFRMSDSTLARQYFTGGFSSTSLSKALAILGPVVHARFEQEGRVVVVTPRPEGR